MYLKFLKANSNKISDSNILIVLINFLNYVKIINKV